MHDVDANDCVDIVQSNTDTRFRDSDVALMLRNEIQTLTRLHCEFNSD